MIAHRRGRIVTIAEDARRPIRLTPRSMGRLLGGFRADLTDPFPGEKSPVRAHAVDGGTVF